MEVINKKEFKKDGPFSDDYEKNIRTITNKNGRGNSAYDPEAERGMLPQDKLVKVSGWTHGRTGLSVEFLWASGRQDAYIETDIPNPDNLPHVHEQLIKQAS